MPNPFAVLNNNSNSNLPQKLSPSQKKRLRKRAAKKAKTEKRKKNIEVIDGPGIGLQARLPDARFPFLPSLIILSQFTKTLPNFENPEDNQHVLVMFFLLAIKCGLPLVDVEVREKLCQTTPELLYIMNFIEESYPGLIESVLDSNKGTSKKHKGGMLKALGAFGASVFGSATPQPTTHYGTLTLPGQQAVVPQPSSSVHLSVSSPSLMPSPSPSATTPSSATAVASPSPTAFPSPSPTAFASPSPTAFPSPSPTAFASPSPNAVVISSTGNTSSALAEQSPTQSVQTYGTYVPPLNFNVQAMPPNVSAQVARRPAVIQALGSLGEGRLMAKNSEQNKQYPRLYSLAKVQLYQTLSSRLRDQLDVISRDVPSYMAYSQYLSIDAVMRNYIRDLGEHHVTVQVGDFTKLNQQQRKVFKGYNDPVVSTIITEIARGNQNYTFGNVIIFSTSKAQTSSEGTASAAASGVRAITSAVGDFVNSAVGTQDSSSVHFQNIRGVRVEVLQKDQATGEFNIVLITQYDLGQLQELDILGAALVFKKIHNAREMMKIIPRFISYDIKEVGALFSDTLAGQTPRVATIKQFMAARKSAIQLNFRLAITSKLDDFKRIAGGYMKEVASNEKSTALQEVLKTNTGAHVDDSSSDLVVFENAITHLYKFAVGFEQSLQNDLTSDLGGAVTTENFVAVVDNFVRLQGNLSEEQSQRVSKKFSDFAYEMTANVTGGGADIARGFAEIWAGVATGFRAFGEGFSGVAGFMRDMGMQWIFLSSILWLVEGSVTHFGEGFSGLTRSFGLIQGVQAFSANFGAGLLLQGFLKNNMWNHVILLVINGVFIGLKSQQKIFSLFLSEEAKLQYAIKSHIISLKLRKLNAEKGMTYFNRLTFGIQTNLDKELATVNQLIEEWNRQHGATAARQAAPTAVRARAPPAPAAEAAPPAPATARPLPAGAAAAASPLRTLAKAAAKAAAAAEAAAAKAAARAAEGGARFTRRRPRKQRRRISHATKRSARR